MVCILSYRWRHGMLQALDFCWLPYGILRVPNRSLHLHVYVLKNELIKL
jgi:hypothetical protein